MKIIGFHDTIKLTKTMMIKTSFGSLRPHTKADAFGLAKYANNSKIAANMRDGFPSPYSLVDAEAFIHLALNQTPPPRLLAIADEKELIGGIGLMVREDVHRLTAELGYWLAEPFWGRGIVSEAVKAIVEYGFQNLNLVRIFAEPYSSNPASCKVLEKAGFVFEGRLRNNVIKQGVILDSMMYAITRPSPSPS